MASFTFKECIRVHQGSVNATHFADICRDCKSPRGIDRVHGKWTKNQDHRMPPIFRGSNLLNVAGDFEGSVCRCKKSQLNSSPVFFGRKKCC